MAVAWLSEIVVCLTLQSELEWRLLTSGISSGVPGSDRCVKTLVKIGAANYG